MVVHMNKKQVQPATGVKVDPDRSMEHQKTKAYISCRLTELDNQNNTIVNEKYPNLKTV